MTEKFVPYKSEYKRGDLVRITVKGVSRTGIIDTVYRYWQDGTYDIEMTGIECGAVRWKQHIDGGTIEKIEM